VDPFVQQGAEDLLCQCLAAEVNKPGTWGHQLKQFVCAAPCAQPSLINAQGRPQVVEEGDIKTSIKAFVDREYDWAWTTARSLRETVRQVHVEGTSTRDTHKLFGTGRATLLQELNVILF
jgi:hypothetical protein